MQEVCDMVRHYIILSSSYSKGRRIALDIIGIELSNIDIINHMIDKIKKAAVKIPHCPCTVLRQNLKNGNR